MDPDLEAVAGQMTAEERERLAVTFDQWAKQLRLSSLLLRLQRSECPSQLYRPEEPPQS